jgi:hypothetical protein
MRRWVKRSAGSILAAMLAIGVISTVGAADISDCLKDETCPVAGFADADTSSEYHDSLHYCLENGLLQGTSANLLEPNENITGAMVAVILYRVEGSPDSAGDNSVSEDTPSWAQDAMCWANESGILTDADGIGVTKPITWDEFLTMVSRYETYKGRNVEISDFDTGSGYVTRAMAAELFYSLSLSVDEEETDTAPVEPEQDATEQEGSIEDTEQESKSGIKLWIPITVGVVLVLAIGAVLVIRWRNRVDDTPMVDYDIEDDE